MKSAVNRGRTSTGLTRVACLGLAWGLTVLPVSIADAGSGPGPVLSQFDPKRPPSAELVTSVTNNFSVAVAGDLIESRPLSQLAPAEKAFADVLALLRQADVAIGNLETNIIDIRHFRGYPYSYEGDWTLVSTPGVAADLAVMGFDVVGRANNHAFDWGLAGMRETSRRLEQAGIAYAGIGEFRGAARAPGYIDTSRGRVALVSFASTFNPASEALDSHGAAPGRPGLSALRVEQITILPGPAMDQLVKLACQLKQKFCKPPAPKSLDLFGVKFESGDRYGYRYNVNPQDEQEILGNIRLAKQDSDFVIAAIHAHQPAAEGFAEMPAGFLKGLAHSAIDAGADMFVATGIHTFGPMEIYKDRPVFYGLGNFFWGDIQEPLPGELFELNRDALAKGFNNPSQATDADLTALLNADSFKKSLYFESILPVCWFSRDHLKEIRIYPIDLGYGRRLTESGIPRLASGDKAKAILDRFEKISGRFGIHMSRANGYGLIAVP